MSDTIPIQSLTAEGLRAALRDALAGATPVRAVCDFVSSVDWSRHGTADAGVVRLLGELEQLTTDVSEQVIPPATFLDGASRLGTEPDGRCAP